MKRKLILMCMADVLVMTAVIGGTLAGFNTAAENKSTADITVGALGIELTGTAAEKTLEIEKGLPGGETEVRCSVQNRVEEGYTLYTRVTIDKKWKSGAKEELDPGKIRLYTGDGESRTELLAGTNVNGWIVWYADEEQIVLYYTKPLAQGESSGEFISAAGFAPDMDNAYADAEVELGIRADAVQSIAAQDSIPSEWGVYPVIGEDGTIVSIEE